MIPPDTLDPITAEPYGVRLNWADLPSTRPAACVRLLRGSVTSRGGGCRGVSAGRPLGCGSVAGKEGPPQ